MSVTQEKLLELVAIHREHNRSFLQIRLVFEQEIELMWEIDEMTANGLQAITPFEANHTYTLSFFSSWDTSKIEYVTYLTKISLGQSSFIYFSCSREYIQALHLIKNIQHVEQIDTLSFLSRSSSVEQQENERNEEVPYSVPVSKVAWLATFIISVILIGYFGYTNLSFDDTEPVKAEEPTKKVVVASVKVPPKEKVEAKKPAIPVAKLKKTISYSIPRGSVALTFDDGPSKYSEKLVNVLKKYKVGGTFFYIGTRVEQHPEYVEYAKKNGFSIGSHSMSHSSFMKLSFQKQEKELIQTNQLIEKITGEPVILFRPPYGAKNNDTVKLVKKHNSEMVLWNIDTEDWKSRNSKKIIQSVEKEKTSGSIILFHESQATLDALPDIIEYLQKQDLKIVSLQ